MKRIKYAVIIPYIIWILWLITIFYFLEQNAEDSSQVSGAFTEFLMRLFRFDNIDRNTFEHIVRKLAHFCAFTGSGFLGIMALRLQSLKTSLVILIPLHAMLAMISELLQTLSEGRFCSPIDMLIDFSGSCLGILIGILFVFLLKRHIQRSL